MRSWILAITIAVFGSNATADTCNRDLLVDMASEVLAKRGQLKGFAGRRIGGDAAYFLLRYGANRADELTGPLQAGRPYADADELFMAQRITALGPKGTALWGEDPRDVLMSAFWPVQRAILLLDNGQTFFDIIRQIEADPDRAEQFSRTWFFGANLHAILTDQPPEVLEKIAKRAEADGHLVVAASLFALLEEGSYEAFWERNKDSGSKLTKMADPHFMNTNGTIALARATALSDPDQTTSPELLHQRQQLLVSFKASMAEAGTPIIAIALNQSGETDGMARVSERFLASVQTGKINPERRPEEGWAGLLAFMTDEFGHQDAASMLTGFDSMADRRHYSGRTLAMLEMATASEAASAWLRGDASQAPGKPESLSKGFDWPEALAVWSLVKSGGFLPDEALAGQVLTLVLEGHLQRGETGAALDVAERAGGIRKRLAVARDVMYRQNRLCERYGILPGQSVLLGGMLLHDFQ